MLEPSPRLSHTYRLYPILMIVHFSLEQQKCALYLLMLAQGGHFSMHFNLGSLKQKRYAAITIFKNGAPNFANAPIV